MRARVLIGAAFATAMWFPPAVDAAFPGRDGLIAFTRADGSKPTQIYVIRPNGQGLRQLTHRRLGAREATWSPDGGRIAFTSHVYGVGAHVFVKHLGGGVRRITRGPDMYMYPTWSPDGRGIAAVRWRWVGNEGFYEGLVVMRADGTRERVLLESDWMGFGSTAWSPDGQSIAFGGTGIDFNGADPGLYVVPARGGPARRIANVGGSQDDPDWSPDGRLIAYAWGDVLGSDDIRVVRPDDTGHARITDDTRPRRRAGVGTKRPAPGDRTPRPDPDDQARRRRSAAGHPWTRGRQRLRPELAAAARAQAARQSTLSRRRRTARITPGIAAWPTAVPAPRGPSLRPRRIPRPATFEDFSE